MIETPGQEIDLDIKREDSPYEKFGLVKLKVQEKSENYLFVNFTPSIDKVVFKGHEIFLKIYNKRNFEEWRPIYMTNGLILTEENRSWEPVEIAKSLIDNDDIEKKIKFEVLLFNNKTKKIKLLTHLIVNTLEIIRQKENKFSLVLKSGKIYHLNINDVNETPKFKFYDYLISEIEIKTMLFIDLTKSKTNVELTEKVMKSSSLARLISSTEEDNDNKVKDENLLIINNNCEKLCK